MSLSPVVQYLTSLPATTWEHLGEFILASAFTSVVFQALKPTVKKLEAKYGITTKKLLVTVFGLLSFLVSYAGDVVSALQQNPILLGEHTAEVASLALVIYHFGASKLFGDIQAYVITGTLPSSASPKS